MPDEVEALCKASLVSIPPEYHAGVAGNLEQLTAQARLLLDWPLPEETQSAALFSA